MVFDHLKLVRRDVREVAKFRTFLLSVQAGEVMHAAVEHESDNSCCRREDGRTFRSSSHLPVRQTRFSRTSRLSCVVAAALFEQRRGQGHRLTIQHPRGRGSGLQHDVRGVGTPDSRSRFRIATFRDPTFARRKRGPAFRPGMAW